MCADDFCSYKKAFLLLESAVLKKKGRYHIIYDIYIKADTETLPISKF